MSSPNPPIADVRPQHQGPRVSPSKEGTSRYVQEKIMIALTLVFFGGVIVLSVVPEPFRGAAMGMIMFLTLVAMYRFS